jgi:magnesium transporter
MAERPTSADVDRLAERFGLHQLDAEQLRSHATRPKLVVRPGYLVAILDFPVQLARPRRTGLVQLRLIVGPAFVLVVHSGELRPPVHLMDDLRADPARRADEVPTPGALAYTIVRDLVEASEPSLGRLRSALEALDEGIHTPGRGESVRQLAQLRREVAAVGRALRPDVEVLFAMARAKFVGSGGLDAYWELVADRLQRLVDGLDEVWSGLDVLAESHAALQRERADERLRALLLLAAVVAPVAAVGGVYALTPPTTPGQWDLELGVGAAILVTAALVAWLRRRRLV